MNPWQTTRENQVDDSLGAAINAPRRLAAMRPPFPQRFLPERFGYAHQALTIEDVLTTDRWRPMRRSWVSGAAVEPERSSWVGDEWSGTLRNSSTVGG